MKPNPITKSNFQTIPANGRVESLRTKNLDNPFSFQDFTVPEQMTHQEIQPPSYIWDRISKVLDEQDRMNALSDDSSFSPVMERENNKIFILYAAVIMIVGAFVASLI